jgi:hypothetical protein
LVPSWQVIDAFDVIVQDALRECKAPQFNLLLAYELPATALQSAFVTANRSQAEKWLADPAPRDLFFSHGEFFRGKRGTDYILNELSRKSLSRRALLSMLDMDTVLASGDRSVPAFSLLQFAIDESTLYVTAYFRALEVGSFLPTNLAEIALHCERICQRFAQIRRIRLLVVAFRAYHEPEFFCLEKLPIDSEEPGTIGVAVAEHRYETLRGWLTDKYRVESVVQMQGMEEMLTAVRASTRQYPKVFVVALEKAVASLRAFKDLRSRYSEGVEVDRARKNFDNDLRDALDALPGNDART